MRILITGLPGWLGNRFLEVLIKGFRNEGPLNDWHIRCLVMDGSDISSLEALSRIKQIEIVTGDVTRAGTLTQVLRDVDLVYHVAGVIHPKKINQLYRINELGTRNMLTQSVENRVKKFIYVSSNSAGGTNLHRAIFMTEDEPPRPYMHYGLSKYKAECAVKEFQESGKIQTVILRPCWFYGPNQPERQTVFFRMIKKGKPIIFGDGNNLRSLSYTDNTCQALLVASTSDRANGQTYWIADARPYATNEIYRTVAEILDVKNYRPVHVPGWTSEMFLLADKCLQGGGFYIKEIHVAGEMNKDIACSIEKAKQELGYAPTVELREGMRRSVEWCRAHGITI